MIYESLTVILYIILQLQRLFYGYNSKRFAYLPLQNHIG